jgi:hexulose-6-phosphate isomerase
MHKISLMQGRLLPPIEDRFQAYPAEGWQNEFIEGARLGLYSIEWIYEKPHFEENLLSTDLGISDLQKAIQDNGVFVRSICADYYMTEHLISNEKPISKNWEHLEWLCGQAKKLDVEYIVLPFVDISSLKADVEKQALAVALKYFLGANRNHDIEIHLETDLAPKDFLKIFREVNHPLLKLNYDIGNSASLGYDPDEEFELLGCYLGSVHIKDRALKGKTVPLGTGNANFQKCFYWFKKLNFNRWYVLQAARGEIGQEFQNILSQINFTLNCIEKYGS